MLTRIFMTISFALIAISAQAGTCDYNKILKVDYVERIRFATTLNNSRDLRPLDFTSEDDNRPDIVSLGCLSCHDGKLANHAAVGIGESNGTLSGSHPIGMDYAKVSFTKPRYVNKQNINRAIYFIEGKVGCMSCHNPVNDKPNHLVTDMENSELCFTCHNK
jgi:predicted CXXCH cytochrome family protein